MKNRKYDEKLKKLDRLARKRADEEPALVEEGKRALERIGFSRSNSIYSFIRRMIRVLGISSFRPATRFPEVACWYVGKQLKNNEDFRYKFYKTTVNHDQTMFNIDGERFETNASDNCRSKRSNVDESIEELEKPKELETTSSATTIESHDSIKKDESSIFIETVKPVGTSDNSLCPMNLPSENEIESETRPVEIDSCNSVPTEFDFFGESDEFFGLDTSDL